ncbi:4-hydroxythreonine-4-phosphate dehydrogenase [Microbacterium sp. SLBN-154]|uniref:4-hydroxythreonine-4-phosphate dehydrogenase PdxA n=1 Tax=Microbacterium sp. SLBN-154 TaxID=2768458 RepID=UPI00114D8218|nr:4-hydroxythreonine-4-phosphate dehydrogenase PdxA [Microbacterium sp. SLBN-154]TQK17657.1 4-hydroxythreonine-4-phosphate dehydrogenase [Microbacterium sp. SLBN-154]
MKPLGLTVGDPAGVGPELSLAVASDPRWMPSAPVILIGSIELLARVAAHIDMTVQFRPVLPGEPVTARPGVAHVIDVPLDAAAVVPGRVTADNGRFTVDTISRATRLAQAGKISAVISAPASKEAFNLAGYHYEGQTEIFADLTGTEGFHTLLVGGPMRVSLVSAHCSMLEAVSRVNFARITRILGELDATLRARFGLADPRIGVAGLNPHAGENGLFGREEVDEVRPAVESLRRQGRDVVGPLPSDSLFAAAEDGRFDAVLAMYHDQATIPLKRYGYVSYAAGLPIIRTTPGHGTAFDIAWTGKADVGLLARAASLAESLAERRPATA